MADRQTYLDISVFSLGGSWLNNLVSADYSFSPQLVEGRTVPMRWARGVVVGQRNTIRARLNRGTAPAWKVNLDVSVFDVGGNVLKGNLKRGSITVTTDAEDGKGIADRHGFPNALGTDVTIEGELLYSGTADRALIQLMDDAVSALSVTATVTVGGESIELPCVIEDITWSGQVRGIQRYRIRLRLEGTLGANGGMTAVPTHSLLASILTGTSVVAVQVKTSAALGDGFDVTGNALITSARVVFEDAQLIQDEFDLELQGAPVIANA